MTEGKVPYLAGIKQDRRDRMVFLIILKAILRFAVVAGVVAAEFNLFTRLRGMPGAWGWMLGPSVAVAIAALAAAWAIERIGK